MVRGLSARQEECLRLTAFLTDKEIAAQLGLSEATVKKHVHEACRRLGVNRRKAALALLDRNVPPPTKDPIDAPEAAVANARSSREHDDGLEQAAVAAVDVGRSGGGAGPVQPVGGGRSGQTASDAGADRRFDGGQSPGASAPGAERGLGDGPGRRATGRLGYRPPPGGWGPRLLIILMAVVLIAVMAKAVADLVSTYVHQAQRIDVLTPDRPIG